MQFDPVKIKLIVGLGNIGKKYEATRHNAGFIFVDILVDHIQQASSWSENTKLNSFIIELPNMLGRKLVIAKPTTMMNLSGKSVEAISKYFKLPPSEILIVYDDLDIPIGKYKIQFSSGPKVHNGLTSVRQSLGTNDFWHLRLGVEGRETKGNSIIPGVEYTLHRFGNSEMDIFQEMCKEITKMF